MLILKGDIQPRYKHFEKKWVYKLKQDVNKNIV